MYSDEEETNIGDTQVIKNILEGLGFEKLITIDNTKNIFENERYEIVLEDVKELGKFIEIEYHGKELHVTNADVLDRKKMMRDYLDSLGLDLGIEQNSGKPELMLNKLREKTIF